MIERVIAAIRPVTSSITVIANSGEYARLGLPVVADTYVGIGPLEAIRTAMANSPTPRAVLVGCDLPFVTSQLFSYLLSIEGSYQAIVPVGPDERLEPLCAIYSAQSLESVTALIESGERKVSRLFELIPTRFVAFDEVRRLRGSGLFFENVNTVEDYRRAIRALSGEGAEGV